MNEKDLPKPQKDLPLPRPLMPEHSDGGRAEKEIPTHSVLASQGETLRSYGTIFSISTKWMIIGIAAVFLFLIFAISAFLLLQNNADKQVVCTQDAKLCSDGSYVGRTGPACEFAACPTISIDEDETTDWKRYNGDGFSINYPKDYEFYQDKIVATQGILEPAENTIQLISPSLPNSNGNLSIIIAYKKTSKYLEEEVQSGSTCPELSEKKLEPIKIGNHTFSQSGLINCGPNQVAFFYILNGKNIYEAKVETTADYEKDALPVVKQILSTLEFLK